MVKSIPQQYQVADFIEWNDKKQLTLNPDFQRRSVWTPDGKSYLIDTILHGFPMPTVYLRTSIDPRTQRSIRDIVDGQQRLKAILDFAKGKLKLNKRAKDYAGLEYSALDEDAQEAFLSYAISVEQLLNATDEDVLETFSRLNSYTVPLNPQELRNARFRGDFKWKVREMALELRDFWTRYQVLSTRDRLRMVDDELTAEMFGVILEGVRAGGKPGIDRLYEAYDPNFPQQQADRTKERVGDTIDFICGEFDEEMRGDYWSRPTQTLILFAAVAHALAGIPTGDIKDMPKGSCLSEIHLDSARANLAVLADAVTQPDPPERFVEFIRASAASTQRIKSRRIRFALVWQALTGEV